MRRSWQGRLLGALGVLAFGVGGAAWAEEPPKDAGGSGEAEASERPEWISDTGEALEQTPGESDQSRSKGLIGAEQLSTQPPGTGGSGPPIVMDASEVRAPGVAAGNPPQLTVAVDVGLDGYTGDLGGMMMTGVGYGIRVGTRIWEHVGVELEYSGSRNGIQREWAPENGAAVSRHAADVIVTGGRSFESGVRPYAGVGFGVGRFAPNSYARPAFEGDWFTEVPLVAGVDYQLGPVYAGLRGDWRFLMGEEFADSLRDREVHGSMLGLSLNLGGRF